jgi:hypothetical protein
MCPASTARHPPKRIAQHSNQIPRGQDLWQVRRVQPEANDRATPFISSPLLVMALQKSDPDSGR